jgi:3-oxoacyl-[acyl-carrier-protein] synthase
MLSRFVVSGFQSFKALSPEPCRPFDADRTGLNLGEAASTVILTRRAVNNLEPSDVLLTDGAIRNDANHISGPSRTGEGCFRALRHILRNIPEERLTDEIAFVNAHGTATPYNDEMESIALTRAALDRVPVNSLKGYLGHTLGAAGVLETILAAESLRAGIALPTAGFHTLGVTHPIRVTNATAPITARRCIKMLSGFGGCNAALLVSLPDC